jgi:predicted NUDIX family NTP pyrophosphohydrolase
VGARTAVSSGLLLFRRTGASLEIFLAHPGGPFWARRDAGAWTIPKGVVDEGEDLLDAARREFREETGVTAEAPFLSLGSVRQKAGKTVHAWAWEGDANADAITSNTTRAEWPRSSGNWIEFPEVDRCAWFDIETARFKINPAQSELLQRLEAVLTAGGDADKS